MAEGILMPKQGITVDLHHLQMGEKGWRQCKSGRHPVRV